MNFTIVFIIYFIIVLIFLYFVLLMPVCITFGKMHPSEGMFKNQPVIVLTYCVITCVHVHVHVHEKVLYM